MIRKILCALFVVVFLVVFYHQKKEETEKGDLVLVPVFQVEQGHKFFSDYIKFSYQILMPIEVIDPHGGIIVVTLDEKKIAHFDSVYDSQKSVLYYQNLLPYRLVRKKGKTTIQFGSTHLYVKKQIKVEDVAYAVLKVRKRQTPLVVGVADANGVILTPQE